MGGVIRMPRKKLCWMISITSIILILIIVIGGALLITKYNRANKLCAQIKNKEIIDTTISNATTAPVFLNHFFTITQLNEVKIPLVEACFYGHEQAVQLLLENGADPNYTISGYWTPIEAAISGTGSREEKFRIVKILVQYGADVNLYESTEPIIFTLASWLTLEGSDSITEDMILWLLEHGAVTETDQGSLLHLAVRGTNPTFVRTLIETYKLPVNGLGFQQQTPLISILYFANQTSKENDIENQVQILLESGADPSIKDQFGKTAYDYAMSKGLVNIADMLRP